MNVEFVFHSSMAHSGLAKMAEPPPHLAGLGVACAPSASVLGGHSKRKSARALPLSVHLYTHAAGSRPHVHGAVRVHEVRRLPSCLSKDEEIQLRNLGTLQKSEIFMLLVNEPRALPESLPLQNSSTWRRHGVHHVLGDYHPYSRFACSNR